MRKHAAEFLPNGEVVDLNQDGKVTLFYDVMAWDYCYLRDSHEIPLEIARLEFPELFSTRDEWVGPESFRDGRFLVHVYP